MGMFPIIKDVIALTRCPDHDILTKYGITDPEDVALYDRWITTSAEYAQEVR